jgi:hypothetical protein
VYGQEKKFGSFEETTEVYKLAHEMQITSLLHVVEKELLEAIDVFKALHVYDLFKRLENRQGLQLCKTVRYFYCRIFVC